MIQFSEQLKTSGKYDNKFWHVAEAVRIIRKKQTIEEIKQELDMQFVHKVITGQGKIKGRNIKIGWKIKTGTPLDDILTDDEERKRRYFKKDGTLRNQPLARRSTHRFIHASFLITCAMKMCATLDCEEQILWFNVIKQAITDALNFGNSETITFERRSAYLYLFSKEFIVDCSWIDVRPELIQEYVNVVRKLVQEAMENDNLLVSNPVSTTSNLYVGDCETGGQICACDDSDREFARDIE